MRDAKEIIEDMRKIVKVSMMNYLKKSIWMDMVERILRSFPRNLIIF